MAEQSSSSDQVSTAVRCSHARCSCTSSFAKSVNKDGQFYCSAGCAEGKGCNHPECSCADPIGLGQESGQKAG